MGVMACFWSCHTPTAVLLFDDIQQAVRVQSRLQRHYLLRFRLRSVLQTRAFSAQAMVGLWWEVVIARHGSSIVASTRACSRHRTGVKLSTTLRHLVHL